MNSKIAELLLGREELPSHTSVGFYPLYYVTKDNKVLCPKCANDLVSGNADPYEVLTADDIVEYAINWENQNLRCENDHLIDSAIVVIEERENENK